MSDNLLPPHTGDDSHDPRHLPARSGTGLVRHTERQALSLDLLDEPRRDPDEIDLLAYWRMLVKRRWLVLSCVGGALLLALLATLVSTPLYRATVSGFRAMARSTMGSAPVR